MQSQAYRDKYWAIVAVFGTLWGGIELTLGTFLHTLHVPKTGLIMVALSVVLLVAQRRIFPARGLTLCTGVVAACIKSLSPGGIILGPMLGIVSEAIVVELFLLLGSTAYIHGIVAGSMALLWTQLFSVVRKWMIYGGDFIKALFKFVDKFLTFESTSLAGWTILLVVIGIILGVGGFSGFLGARLGRRVQARLNALECETPENLQQEIQAVSQDALQAQKEIQGSQQENLSVPTKALVPVQEVQEIPHDAMASEPMRPASEGAELKIIASVSKKQQPADEQILKTRWFLMPIAVVTLGIQFCAGFWSDHELYWAIPSLVVWMAALAIGARNVLKSIWWPKFWLVSIVVSLICGVILAWNFDGAFQWRLGIEATVRMLVRGVFVFSWICWATRSVRTNEFLKLWQKLGIPNLGHAITHAYVLLPQWLDRLNAIVKNHPKGFRNNWKYLNDCILLCLVDAVKQTEI